MSTKWGARRWLGTWALVLVAALAQGGCGGGGGGGAGAEEGGALLPQRAYFPVSPGDLWIYEQSDAAVPLSLRATGLRSVDGRSGVVVLADDASVGESVFVVSADGVRQYPGSGADPITAALGAVQLMRYPLRQGDSFVQIDRTIDTATDFDGDGRNESAQVRSDVVVVGLETVATPAGTFADSLHLRSVIVVTVRLTGVGQTATVTTTSDDWYAPDVGPVRNVLTVSSEGTSETTTQQLSAYRVGTRRSETVAPTVLSVTPADGSVQARSVALSARFSEPPDADTLAAGFTLTDPSGQPVAGSVSLSGDTATWVSAAPLSGGRHTARLATTVTDLLGNPLAAPQQWAFDVDTTAPALVGSTPADGAVDVPLTGPYELRFSEVLDTGSVDAYSVRLSGPFGTVPSTLRVDGATVTLTPAQPLERGADYQLLASGDLRDQYGNGLGDNAVVRFRADEGRFGLPTRLLDSFLSDAMAIGDVDGDGRPDLLASTGYSSDPAQNFKLMIYRQQADGRLAAPVVVDTRASYACRPSTLAIGDIDGDGRNEVLVGASGCGIEIFHRNDAGAMVSIAFIDTARSHKLRLGDFNGDGRLDLVAIGWSDTAAQLWLQSAGGALVAAPAPAIEYFGWTDLQVGDLNGDGRLDFVVTSGQGDRSRSVGIALQQADGSFGAPVYRAADPAWGARGVGVGDVNGDGRQDIVVSFGGNSPTSIGLYLQGADGSIGALTTMSTLDSPLAVAVVDVNQDGRGDVVVSHDGWSTLSLYLQQSDGSLAAEARYRANSQGYNPHALAVGDVNGDGRVDVAIAGELLLQRAVGPMALAVRPVRGAAAAVQALRTLQR